MNIKQAAEIFVVPLAICIVGVWATFKSTDTQNKNSEKLAENQYDLSEKHHIQTLNMLVTEKFYLLLESSDVCKSNKRIEFLISESTPNRATELRSIFLKHCSDQPNEDFINLEISSNIAVKNSQLKRIQNLINDLQGAGRGLARAELTNLYEQNPAQVGEELSKAIESNFADYRTTLGILVVLSNVKSGWQSTDPLFTKFTELAKSPNIKDDTFLRLYKKAENNKVIKN